MKLVRFAVVIAAIAGILLAAAEKPRIPNTSLAPEQRAAHLLNRLGYGPRPGDIAQVLQIGEAAWIERQLHPETISDDALAERLAPYSTLRMSQKDLLELFPRPNLIQRLVREGRLDESLVPKRRPGRQSTPGGQAMAGGRGFNPLQWEIHRLDEPIDPPGRPRGPRIRGINPQQVLIAELQAAKLVRAVYSERQLQQAMTDFWINHFNVFAAKNQVRALVTAYERDVIRPNALGNFRDLLGAVAQSPAMLAYLDNAQSFGPDSPVGRRRKIGLNENYARELLELHTLGVEGGYTQHDVTEAARVLTGWTAFGGPRFSAPGFRFLAVGHDAGAKTVLGETYRPAGIAEGERLLDNLAAHPATANFLATKLVRRFVADDPPPALVKRVAASYRKTGGDIPAMLRVIFYSQEFWSPDAYRAKVKKPLDLVASALRAVDAELLPNRQVLGVLQRMGEPLYLCQPPTGYPDTADQWLGSDQLVTRWNFALALAKGRAPGVSWDAPKTFARQTPKETLTALWRRYLLEDPAPATIAKLLDAAPFADNALLTGFVLGSPEFQRR